MSEIRVGDAVSGRSRRRSRLESYLDVLRVIQDGEQKPTRIMFEANLSWNPMKRILGSMVSQGFIREVDVSGGRDGRSSRHYEITQKGEGVLGYLSRGGELVELIEATRNGAQR